MKATTSQEREDEQEVMAVTEYHLDQVAEAEPQFKPVPMNWAEKAVWWSLGALALLLVWIFGRGAYLATRELIRWL